MPRILFALAVYLFLSLDTNAQFRAGFQNSNYAGIWAVHANPANLAYSKYRFNLNLLDINQHWSNNFAKKQNAGFSNSIEDTYPGSFINKNSLQFNNTQFIDLKDNGNPKALQSNSSIGAFAFQFGFKNKSGIAFTNRTRQISHITFLNQALLNFFLDDDSISSAERIGQDQKLSNLGMGSTVFHEMALSYGMVVKETKNSILKVGMTAKYLFGIRSLYTSVSDLQYTVNGNDQMNISRINATYAYTDDNYYNDSKTESIGDYLGKDGPGKGWGLNIGFVYDIIPDKRTKKLEVGEPNNYKWRLGLSLNDIGRINFNNENIAIRKELNSTTATNLDVSNRMEWQDMIYIDTLFQNLYPNVINSSNSFVSKLPTSLNLMIDRRLNERFFISLNGALSMRNSNVEGTKINEILSVSGRYETKWLEGALSITTGNFYEFVHFGAMLRAGIFYVGSDDLLNLFSKNKTGMNVFAGAHWPLHHKNTRKDSDNDGIIDSKDNCPYESGEASAKGCPDSDNDGVPNSEDLCPYEIGTKATNGCPDPDNDGLYGEDDECPQEFGLAENKGCPVVENEVVNEEKVEEEPKVPKKIDNETNNKPQEKDKVVETEKPKIEDRNIEVKVENNTKKPNKNAQNDLFYAQYLQIDNFDTDKYRYYLVMAAFKNVDGALSFSNTLKNKGYYSRLLYVPEKGINYLIGGIITDKEQARTLIKKYKSQEFYDLINGHLWWYKVEIGR